MATIEKSIDINVDVQIVYNQWTQFEDFPQFMEGVKEVRQLDDKNLHFRADIDGVEKEWDIELTEQIPDERVAWRSTSGAPMNGLVTFNKTGNGKTRVMMEIYYADEYAERSGNREAAASARIEHDLERFKDFIESRGHETGAWRGTIPRESSPPPQ